MGVTVQDAPSTEGRSLLLLGLQGVGKTATAADVDPFYTFIVKCDPKGTNFLPSTIRHGNSTYPAIRLMTDSTIRTVAELRANIDKYCSMKNIKIILIDGITHLIKSSAEIMKAEGEMKSGKNGSQYFVPKYRNPQMVYIQITADIGYIVNRLSESGKTVIATGHYKSFSAAEFGAELDDILKDAEIESGARQEDKYAKKDEDARQVLAPDCNPRAGLAMLNIFTNVAVCYSSGHTQEMKPITKMVLAALVTKESYVMAKDRTGTLPISAVLTTEMLRTIVGYKFDLPEALKVPAKKTEAPKVPDKATKEATRPAADPQKAPAFTGKPDAITWASSKNVYAGDDAKEKLSNEYDALKAKINPSSAPQMFSAWIDYVDRLVAAAQAFTEGHFGSFDEAKATMESHAAGSYSNNLELLAEWWAGLRSGAGSTEEAPQVAEEVMG
jgi:hypothetical protein